MGEGTERATVELAVATGDSVQQTVEFVGSIDKLLGKLDELNSSLKQTENTAKAAGEGEKKAGEQSQTWSAGLKNVAKELAAVNPMSANFVKSTADVAVKLEALGGGNGPLAAVIAGYDLLSAAVRYAKEGFDAVVESSLKAMEVRNTATAVGMVTREFSMLQQGMEETGVTSGEFSLAMRQMSVRMKEAYETGGQAGGAYAKLGVDVRTATGEMKSRGEILAEFADKLQGVQDAGQRTALATEAFGRSGAKMLVGFREGGAGIREMLNDVGNSILATSDASADMGLRATKALDNIGDAGDIVGKYLKDSFQPLVVGTLESVADAATGAWKTAFPDKASFDDAVKRMQSALNTLLPVIKNVADDIGAVFGSLLDWMRRATGQIADLVSEIGAEAEADFNNQMADKIAEALDKRKEAEAALRNLQQLPDNAAKQALVAKYEAQLHSTPFAPSKVEGPKKSSGEDQAVAVAEQVTTAWREATKATREYSDNLQVNVIKAETAVLQARLSYETTVLTKSQETQKGRIAVAEAVAKAEISLQVKMLTGAEELARKQVEAKAQLIDAEREYANFSVSASIRIETAAIKSRTSVLQAYESLTVARLTQADTIEKGVIAAETNIVNAVNQLAISQQTVHQQVTLARIQNVQAIFNEQTNRIKLAATLDQQVTLQQEKNSTTLLQIEQQRYIQQQTAGQRAIIAILQEEQKLDSMREDLTIRQSTRTTRMYQAQVQWVQQIRGQEESLDQLRAQLGNRTMLMYEGRMNAERKIVQAQIDAVKAEGEQAYYRAQGLTVATQTADTTAIIASNLQSSAGAAGSFAGAMGAAAEAASSVGAAMSTWDKMKGSAEVDWSGRGTLALLEKGMSVRQVVDPFVEATGGYFGWDPQANHQAYVNWMQEVEAARIKGEATLIAQEKQRQQNLKDRNELARGTAGGMSTSLISASSVSETLPTGETYTKTSGSIAMPNEAMLKAQTDLALKNLLYYQNLYPTDFTYGVMANNLKAGSWSMPSLESSASTPVRPTPSSVTSSGNQPNIQVTVNPTKVVIGSRELCEIIWDLSTTGELKIYRSAVIENK